MRKSQCMVIPVPAHPGTRQRHRKLHIRGRCWLWVQTAVAAAGGRYSGAEHQSRASNARRGGDGMRARMGCNAAAANTRVAVRAQSRSHSTYGCVVRTVISDGR